MKIEPYHPEGADAHRISPKISRGRSVSHLNQTIEDDRYCGIPFSANVGRIHAYSICIHMCM